MNDGLMIDLDGSAMVEIGVGDVFDRSPESVGLLVLEDLSLAPRVDHDGCPDLDLVFLFAVDDLGELGLVFVYVSDIGEEESHIVGGYLSGA